MKKIIRLALRKPVIIIVALMALVYFSIVSLSKIKVDVFPEVESPAVYIAMPYGGLSPEYMDGFMSNELQKVLVFVGGVDNIEFQSVQGLSLTKLTFAPGTDMAEAQAEIATQVSRSMAFLPPGAVPPQVVRFDAGAQPVGQLVFESEGRSISEIQNYVTSRIRPSLINIDGVSAPGPFGGNVRSMVVNVDPEEMQAHNLTADDIMESIGKSNFPSPAGNVDNGDKNYMAPVNTMQLGEEDFMNTPITTESGANIYVRDVANVKDEMDKTTGYALVNGERTVYMPVIREGSASTLAAINNLKDGMGDLKNLLPDDVDMDFVFDQSDYITNALSNLAQEGIIGAVLTGLMVLLFLGDTRGAVIVVLTIPISLLTAIIILYLMGQTINIMTLSGLALSIGILVDEATVTMENIHQHLAEGKSKPRAILDALLEIAAPLFLILLCILAVLVPSFMMIGIPRDMFMPLSIAVGSAMVVSYIASLTFVPVVANWFMKHLPEKDEEQKQSRFDRIKERYLSFIDKRKNKKSLIFGGYIVGALVLVSVLFYSIGLDILPPADSKDLQLRINAEQGTSLDKTEEYVLDVEDEINNTMAPDSLAITSSFVGMHSPNMPINPVFLFTSGSHEAVLQFSLPDSYSGSIEGAKQDIRENLNEKFPELTFSFEPMELVEKIMGQGYDNPISVEVSGQELDEVQEYATAIRDKLKKEDYLNDVRIDEPLNYPSIQIDVNRDRAAQLGLTMEDVSSVLTTATSSSRFVDKNMWVDPESGLVFQLQTQISEKDVDDLNDLRKLPLKSGEDSPILDDIADLKISDQPGQVNRRGSNKYVTVSGNLNGIDLGAASDRVENAIADVDSPSAGYDATMQGKVNILKDTLSGLERGLLIAVIVIFLLLTAYYQSFKTSLVIMSVVFAVVTGSLLSLTIFGSTLNLQSYMGMIMAVGVSISNAVLLIDQAEIARRKKQLDVSSSALFAVNTRFRPILMTTIAMVAGMVPMALGLGDGGGQVAPLGQSVIGGLLFSTLTSLLILPFIYMRAYKNAKPRSISLDPDDENSPFYENALNPKS